MAIQPRRTDRRELRHGARLDLDIQCEFIPTEHAAGRWLDAQR